MANIFLAPIPVVGQIAANVVGQLGDMALGLQKGFNWKSLGMSVISAGVKLPSFNVGNSVANAALNSAAHNIATQGIGVAVGLQDRFDWTGVAVAGVSAGATRFAAGQLAKVSPALAEGGRLNNALSGAIGGVAGVGAYSALTGTSFGTNLTGQGADIVAGALGSYFSTARRSGGDGGGDLLTKAVHAAGNIFGFDGTFGYQSGPGREYSLGNFGDALTGGTARRSAELGQGLANAQRIIDATQVGPIDRGPLIDSALDSEYLSADVRTIAPLPKDAVPLKRLGQIEVMRYDATRNGLEIALRYVGPEKDAKWVQIYRTDNPYPYDESKVNRWTLDVWKDGSTDTNQFYLSPGGQSYVNNQLSGNNSGTYFYDRPSRGPRNYMDFQLSLVVGAGGGDYKIVQSINYGFIRNGAVDGARGPSPVLKPITSIPPSPTMTSTVKGIR